MCWCVYRGSAVQLCIITEMFHIVRGGLSALRCGRRSNAATREAIRLESVARVTRGCIRYIQKLHFITNHFLLFLARHRIRQVQSTTRRLSGRHLIYLPPTLHASKAILVTHRGIHTVPSRHYTSIHELSWSNCPRVSTEVTARGTLWRNSGYYR